MNDEHDSSQFNPPSNGECGFRSVSLLIILMPVVWNRFFSSIKWKNEKAKKDFLAKLVLTFKEFIESDQNISAFFKKETVIIIEIAKMLYLNIRVNQTELDFAKVE